MDASDYTRHFTTWVDTTEYCQTRFTAYAYYTFPPLRGTNNFSNSWFFVLYDTMSYISYVLSPCQIPCIPFASSFLVLPIFIIYAKWGVQKESNSIHLVLIRRNPATLIHNTIFMYPSLGMLYRCWITRMFHPSSVQTCNSFSPS